MGRSTVRDRSSGRAVPKVATGIRGLDEITGGGLPRGTNTLITGDAGSGKTLFAAEFLARGATEHGEPGVFVSFEETAPDLTRNVRSLGFDLDRLVARRKLIVDHVRVERSEIHEAGPYDLDGLFVRLAYAIDRIGAKRVALDTIEVLFAGLNDTAVLRAELRRLFRWLKERGVTAIVTAERGEGRLTRHGIEEYVSDCVILVDQRVVQQVTTRRIRVVKYRGSRHGMNEYPFLIDDDGIVVFPITSLGLNHEASREIVPSGLPGLDAMLGAGGFYRGSSVLVSGTAGAGKTNVAALFAAAACGRGERCLYCAFEESPSQIERNVRSIGTPLDRWRRRDLLRIHATRPSLYGLESHLGTMIKHIEDFAPTVVVFDPITSLLRAGADHEARETITRLVDFCKSRNVTALMTSLTHDPDRPEQTDADVSSLIDTWVLLRNVERDGVRGRAMYVLKARGMSHSNDIREIAMTNRGMAVAGGAGDAIRRGTTRAEKRRTQSTKSREAVRP